MPITNLHEIIRVGSNENEIAVFIRED
jgi:hypothetical protein